MSRRLRRAAGLVLAVAVAGTAVFAQPRSADRATLDYRLEARALAPGVYVVEGANADFAPANGCNIINTGFVVADDGVLVVNTGPSRRYGEQLRALIERTTPRPIRAVLHLNLHPDYFLGNQAFADVPRYATAATLAGMHAEARAYEDNLYRTCGDWMKGTEAMLPDRVLADDATTLPVGAGRFELRHWQGHTASDLVLIDRASRTAFAGGLVFAERVPTTPHARLEPWLASLAQLAREPGIDRLVPSHGPAARGRDGLAQTQAYLRWLDRSFTAAATQGREMTELLAQPAPSPFRDWAAFATEYPRNVAHLYPAYEQRALLSR
ncbi:MAG TPA: quinoprotein relay system zinc metallohydrolase 1 [Methylibium sp.]|uniref:quinoprotein relay system zinc metallohydrolase 1 n=1 Tax=Methylibium sp. TaxID=2067992 RepID=UPI002DBDF9BE|nr:quinoprotein relay system zinc metallohydrolase 1 [Methylibium sp.]HEU4458306.1 quinoprotein relay system zinc metallohydrolase 1 [Methylibium sp.]